MEWMIHNSFEKGYREPFGALYTGAQLRLGLRLLLEPEGPVLLHLHPEPGEARTVEMEKTGEDFWEARIRVPGDPGLLWYHFSAGREGRRLFCGRKTPETGGRGALYGEMPPSWQVTVYRPDARVPGWFTDTAIYQIFPDRFRNGHPECRVENAPAGSLIHACWEDDPVYVRDPGTGAVTHWDFSGGTLEGIRQKLDYLKNLGIGCIYLNPVFMAASNHRYDTADYLSTDPMLGTVEDFEKLCRQAARRGIRIVLDGVFSHTGSDSIYFNREGRFPGTGAWQSVDSPYYSWYRFRRHPDDYESWWDIPVLPNVNENDAGYQEFILGEEGVQKTWMDRGASGWRLDVADELPDEFIGKFRKAMKERDPDSILIGEVWEDATSKISYGARRRFLLGDQLDSVMNYPFRKAVADFLTGRQEARQTHLILMTLAEHYPPVYFHSVMNLLGSHDTPRILTELGGDRSRLTQALIWQMTFPGVPSVYYGDEAGLTGGKDPDNRKPFPWGREDAGLQELTGELLAIRRLYPVLTGGYWHSFYRGDDLYGFFRYTRGDRDALGRACPAQMICVLLNRGETGTGVELTLPEPVPDGAWHDLYGQGPEAVSREGRLSTEVPPGQARILVRYPENRREMNRRRTGTLCSLSSLPTGDGLGGLEAAGDFVRFLKEGGQSLWQILPWHPPGPGGSPYMAPSAFAGNPQWISLRDVRDRGWLTDEEYSRAVQSILTDQDPAQEKIRWLDLARQRCREEAGDRIPEEIRRFRKSAGFWLEDYALFSALREHLNAPWTHWPVPLRDRHPRALARWARKLRDRVDLNIFLQYLFFSQWEALLGDCSREKISLVGDLPIYVAPDSADVWAHRNLFRLKENGEPDAVAGVPPDGFSDRGQHWGNPLYLWERHRQEGYHWWIQRIRWLLTGTHLVRLDHFRGFADYWAVREDDPRDGAWYPGPGREFFEHLEDQLGGLPFVAENLGILSSAALELQRDLPVAAMQVLQFMNPPEPPGPLRIPLSRKEDFLYTGTHDNETLAGWSGSSAPERWLRMCLNSAADTVVVPLQDWLGLDNQARMNRPGTLEGNWGWKADPAMLEPQVAARIHSLCLESRRIPTGGYDENSGSQKDREGSVHRGSGDYRNHEGSGI